MSHEPKDVDKAILGVALAFAMLMYAYLTH
jgi:hypothetical protein